MARWLDIDSVAGVLTKTPSAPHVTPATNSRSRPKGPKPTATAIAPQPQILSPPQPEKPHLLPAKDIPKKTERTLKLDHARLVEFQAKNAK